MILKTPMITASRGPEVPKYKTNQHPILSVANTRVDKSYDKFKEKEKKDPDPIDTRKDNIDYVTYKMNKSGFRFLRVFSTKRVIFVH